MSHIQYTIKRSGSYFYNRRVPKHAVKTYGSFIRQALSKCPKEAEHMQNALVRSLKDLGIKRQKISYQLISPL